MPDALGYKTVGDIVFMSSARCTSSEPAGCSWPVAALSRRTIKLDPVAVTSSRPNAPGFMVSILLFDGGEKRDVPN
jgi:hypothetical protein